MNSILVIFALSLCVFAESVVAQEDKSYPNKTINLVVAFAPVGPTDYIARLLEKELSQIGWKAVVYNRPGAGGTIAADFVVKAPADGYYWLVAGDTTATATPHLIKTPYENGDLIWLMELGGHDIAFVTHPSVPVRNVKDLIALAKRLRSPLTYGTSGIGTGSHLAGELLNSRAEFKVVTDVPYQGFGPSLVDLLGGRIDLSLNTAQVLQPHLSNGKLKAVGIAGKKRSVLLPEVPTIAESGLPGYEAGVWTWMAVRNGTPSILIERINATVTEVLNNPRMKQVRREKGMHFTPSTPAEFARFAERMRLVNGDLIRKTGIATSSTK